MILILPVSVATSMLPAAHSDSLTGGSVNQRIGIFDVEMKTVPAKPIAGGNTNIIVRIGNIYGEDVVDIPISVKITRQSKEVYSTNTTFVPSGHYTYPFNFAEAGIYGIDILVYDLAAVDETGSQVKFTFPINVRSKSLFDFELVTVLAITIVAAVSAAVIYSLKKKGERKRKTSYQPSGMS